MFILNKIFGGAGTAGGSPIGRALRRLWRRLGVRGATTDLFSISGRRSRRGFIAALSWLNLVIILQVMVTATMVTREEVMIWRDLMLAGVDPLSGLMVLPGLLFAIQIIIGWIALFFLGVACLIGQRLRDAGMSGRIALLALIPPCTGLVITLAMSLPGWPGPNQYGPDPRRR